MNFNSKNFYNIIILFLLFSKCHPAQPFFSEITVFQNGENGYGCFRIPAIIKAPNNDLLAFAEGRVNGCVDHGNIDLVMKRSTDNGVTWGNLHLISDYKEHTAGNPGPVVDYLDPDFPNGQIFLAYNTSTTSEGNIRNGNGIREVWYITSSDNGVNWSAPVNITTSVNKPNETNFNPKYNFLEDWRWYAVTPGHALQLVKGKFKGRLFFAANHTKSNLTNTSHSFYSDDHGKSWQLGGEVHGGSNEATATELYDGRVMINCRRWNGSQNRVVAISDDGGETWGKSYRDTTLITPTCQGSLLSKDNLSKILFSNPANGNERVNLTIRMSLDNGKTWPVGRSLRSGFSAYSDLVIDSNGLIGCLYETDDYNKITYAYFNEDWLKEE